MTQPHGKHVLFFRKGMFYEIQLMGDMPSALEAAQHAQLNPGTLRIETVDGEVLWTAPN